MRDRVLKILRDIRPEFEFDSNLNFIEEGWLDSFDIISLVSDLEAEFDIKISGEQITPENFCGLEAIIFVIQNSSRK